MNQKISEILKCFYEKDLQRYEEGRKIPELLRIIKLNSLSKEKLKQLILIRSELAHFFEDQLRYIIQIIKESALSAEDKETSLKAVNQNLSEELGVLPEYGRAHTDDRKVFLEALGIRYSRWSFKLGTYEVQKEIHQATRFILQQTKALISFGPIPALIVLWYWEHRLSRGGQGEFFLFLSAFEEKYPEFKKDTYKEGDILWWLFSHADHDTYHAQLAANALDAITIDKKVFSKKFINWILKRMDDYFDMYWYLIYSRYRT